jgi:CubicO group peptidase (beta-lactamase class C family)/GNAT superfamily N-acetyltransferase
MTKTVDGARSWPTRVRIACVEPSREEPGGACVRAWHAVVAASMAKDAPGTAPVAPERLHACLTTGKTVVWTATRAGQVVGLAVLRLPSASGTGRAQVHVHPDYRGHGVGGQLMRALIAETRTRGLHSVIVAVPAGGTGDALCRRRGLSLLRTLHHLLLSLRDLHPAWLDEMVAVEHPGYRLTETARIASRGCDDTVLADARPGDVLLTVTAEHGRKVVGCTEVVVPAGGERRVTQHDHPAVDGHHDLGLDLWVKAAMLRLLYDQYPQVAQVATDSPEHDTALLAVNRHLGFRLHHRTNEYRLDVTGPWDTADRTTEPARRSMMGNGNGGFSEAGLRRLRDVLARHVESGRIPGLVALVGRGGQTHVEALGTMRHDGGAPMRRDTIFRMSSTSKPVTTAAAMVLLDECRLRLDDPVDPWLPELADRQVLKRPDGALEDTVPAHRPITVRDVLTSTFGLGVDLPLMGSPIMTAVLERTSYDPDAGPAPEPDEWVRRLGELPLSYQPGERWQYDTAHDLLGVLVARAAGQPFESFLHERVFEPLGMTDTAFHVPVEEIDRLPPVYFPEPGGGFQVWDEAETGRWSKPPAFASGAGGLVSTVDDYHAYFRMLLGHGTYGKERILSRPAVDLMTTNRLTPEQNAARSSLARDNVHLSFGQGQQGGWGFGMGVRTYRGDYAPIGQFGWDGGTGTSAYADPHNDLIGVLLTQVGLSTPDPARLIHDFWTTLYQAIDD